MNNDKLNNSYINIWWIGCTRCWCILLMKEIMVCFTFWVSIYIWGSVDHKRNWLSFRELLKLLMQLLKKQCKGVKIPPSPGAFRVTNNSVKECKDIADISNTWSWYHIITKHTIHVQMCFHPVQHTDVMIQ